jgi:hypothetical protein
MDKLLNHTWTPRNNLKSSKKYFGRFIWGGGGGRKANLYPGKNE